MKQNLVTLTVFAVLAVTTSYAASAQTPPAPDYSSTASWAALPSTQDAADVTPPGYSDQQATAGVDVFYVHPTTYFVPSGNAAFDAGGITLLGVNAALTNQASVFNGCCKIYAPRYRQASGGDITSATPASYAVVDLAYQDVRRAFLYYLANYNQGRPFIIAGHSQGSLHAERLILELITGTPLQDQLVAAYLVGSSDQVDPESAGTFPGTFLGLPICNSPSQIGCSMNWDSVSQFGEDTASKTGGAGIWAHGSYQQSTAVPLCVNPLTWQRDASTTAASNLGGEPFSLTESLSPPNPQLTGARCENGYVVIDPPILPLGYSDLSLTLLGIYHIFDYNLFYLNIRQNATVRAQEYLREHPNCP
jgi:DUF3089 family protein